MRSHYRHYSISLDGAGMTIFRTTESLFRRFGWGLPHAAMWYLSRFLRQSFWLYYFKTVGRYGFSRIGRGVRIDGLPSFIVPCCTIELGDQTRIGKRCVFQGDPGAEIILGRNVTVNDGCFITALYGITIGDQTSIGEYTSVRDYNHSFSSADTPIKQQGYEGSPIHIGTDVWIGRGCTILPGVTIGNGAVIGANSVVNRDVPDLAIAVGCPARILPRTRT